MRRFFFTPLPALPHLHRWKFFSFQSIVLYKRCKWGRIQEGEDLNSSSNMNRGCENYLPLDGKRSPFNRGGRRRARAGLSGSGDQIVFYDLFTSKGCGKIEDIAGLARRRFPKGADFATLSKKKKVRGSTVGGTIGRCIY